MQVEATLKGRKFLEYPAGDGRGTLRTLADRIPVGGCALAVQEYRTSRDGIGAHAFPLKNVGGQVWVYDTVGCRWYTLAEFEQLEGRPKVARTVGVVWDSEGRDPGVSGIRVDLKKIRIGTDAADADTGSGSHRGRGMGREHMRMALRQRTSTVARLTGYLTVDQEDVLEQCVLRGLSPDAAARELSLTDETVRNYERGALESMLALIAAEDAVRNADPDDLAAASDLVPSHQRDAVVLVFDRKLPPHAAAEAMGWSRNELAKVLRRGADCLVAALAGTAVPTARRHAEASVRRAVREDVTVLEQWRNVLTEDQWNAISRRLVGDSLIAELAPALECSEPAVVARLYRAYEVLVESGAVSRLPIDTSPGMMRKPVGSSDPVVPDVSAAADIAAEEPVDPESVGHGESPEPGSADEALRRVSGRSPFERRQSWKPPRRSGSHPSGKRERPDEDGSGLHPESGIPELEPVAVQHAESFDASKSAEPISVGEELRDVEAGGADGEEHVVGAPQIELDPSTEDPDNPGIAGLAGMSSPTDAQSAIGAAGDGRTRREVLVEAAKLAGGVGAAAGSAAVGRSVIESAGDLDDRPGEPPEPVVTGLGKDVDELVMRSATKSDRVAAQQGATLWGRVSAVQQQQWRIGYGDRGEVIVEPDGIYTIVIDAELRGEPEIVVQELAVLVTRALMNVPEYRLEPPSDSMSFDGWSDRELGERFGPRAFEILHAERARRQIRSADGDVEIGSYTEREYGGDNVFGEVNVAAGCDSGRVTLKEAHIQVLNQMLEKRDMEPMATAIAELELWWSEHKGPGGRESGGNSLPASDSTTPEMTAGAAAGLGSGVPAQPVLGARMYGNLDAAGRGHVDAPILRDAGDDEIRTAIAEIAINDSVRARLLTFKYLGSLRRGDDELAPLLLMRPDRFAKVEQAALVDVARIVARARNRGETAASSYRDRRNSRTFDEAQAIVLDAMTQNAIGYQAALDRIESEYARAATTIWLWAKQSGRPKPYSEIAAELGSEGQQRSPQSVSDSVTKAVHRLAKILTSSTELGRTEGAHSASSDEASRSEHDSKPASVQRSVAAAHRIAVEALRRGDERYAVELGKISDPYVRAATDRRLTSELAGNPMQYQDIAAELEREGTEDPKKRSYRALTNAVNYGIRNMADPLDESAVVRGEQPGSSDG